MTEPPRKVFFLRHGEHVKIGCSRYVDARLREASVHLPLAPQLLGVIPGGPAQRAALLERFAPHATRPGAGWFHLGPVLAEIGVLIVKGVQVPALETAPTPRCACGAWKTRRARTCRACAPATQRTPARFCVDCKVLKTSTKHPRCRTCGQRHRHRGAKGAVE